MTQMTDQSQDRMVIALFHVKRPSGPEAELFDPCSSLLAKLFPRWNSH